jgi:glycolate oxidase iron-sulfur subunit
VHDLPRAEAVVEGLPRSSFRERVRPGVYEGTGELRLGYFVGCGMDLLCPEAAEATFAVLRRLGKTVAVLDNCCCGVPAYTYGDMEATQRLVRTNLELTDPEAFDVLATDCSSCAAFLKKYPDHLPTTDPLRTQAQRLASRVRDAVELLAPPVPSPLGGESNSIHSNVWNCPATPSSRASGVAAGRLVIATYHDPCHAVRGQGLTMEPREILRSLPGVEYRELPEADWCCGGAGSYALGHYDLSMQVLDRKMDNVAATGANLLVTACPACLVQLRYGVRRRGLEVRVCHLSELVLQWESVAR